MSPSVKKILRTATTAMVCVAIVFAFFISAIRIFGFEVYGVLTGSMEPAYPTGSLIYVKDVDPSTLRVNDVITFSLSPNVIATHRIVEVVPDENNPSIVRYRTKGDANNSVDANLVSAGNIIGKVIFSIPQMGYIASYIQSPPGIYVAIGVSILMIIFVFITDSVTSEKKGEQPAAKPNPMLEKLMPKLEPLLAKAGIKLKKKPAVPPQQPGYPQMGYASQHVQPMHQQGYQQPQYQPMYQQPQYQPMQQQSYQQPQYQPVQQQNYQQPQYQPMQQQNYQQPQYQPVQQMTYQQPQYQPVQQQSYQQLQYQPVQQQSYQQPQYQPVQQQSYQQPQYQQAPQQTAYQPQQYPTAYTQQAQQSNNPYPPRRTRMSRNQNQQ